MSAEASDEGSIRTGAVVSGGLHTALLLGVALGPVFGAAPDPVPLSLAEVSIIDGAEFDARFSAAPQEPREVPDAPDPALGGEPEPAPEPAASADEPERAPDGSQPSPDPEPSPEDVPELASQPTRAPVPTEAARPTIADIPVPDATPREAAEPESPPSSEPLQPLASADVPLPGPRPIRPPDPEPEPAQEPEPQPTETEIEIEIETDRELTEEQPEAPVSAIAPQVATLPVAKPAELAAAAQASRETRRPEPAESTEADNSEPRQAEAEASRPGAAGSSSQFARLMTSGEKDALSLGIKRYFTYNGSRADRQLSVRIEIGLDPSGRIVRGPIQIAVTGGDPRAQSALFQAGRRALLRAQGAGEFAKLPLTKYDAWRIIHVTFFPDESIGFQS